MMKCEKAKEFYYTGPLSGAISHFFEEMRLSGRVYNVEGYYLRIIDEAAAQRNLGKNLLTQELVEDWSKKKEFESHKTWANRVIVIRKLAVYMNIHGMSAYETPLVIHTRPSDFTPHIYTDEELRRMFQETDCTPSYPNCPLRGAVAAVFFRLIYGCGLRLSEALHLTMKDMDFENGVLTIRESKFNKSRYVPMAPELTARCKKYADDVRKNAAPEAPFFPAPDGGHYSSRAMNTQFRHILFSSGIPYTGRGPRIHDLRHTFAVNCLKKWVREGKDLTAALPILSAYLGHKGLNGTQNYLRLTADMYPDITSAVEDRFGSVIPGRFMHEEG